MKEVGRERPDIMTHKYTGCQTFPSALTAKTIPSLASAFLIHRKDNTFPKPLKTQTKTPYFFTHPLSRNSHSKKHCHNIYRHTHYGRLSLYFGEELKCSADSPSQREAG